jgi:NADH-quinone oxidoreductase subunit F
MSEYMIFNLIPTFSEAPISLNLFLKDPFRFMNRFKSEHANKRYILYPKQSKEMKQFLEQIEDDTDINFLPLETTGAFVYGNKTAVVKVIDGEKPLPTGVADALPVFSAEEFSDIDIKTVMIGGNAKKKGNFTFSKKITPRAILEQCSSVKEWKGMYFGYPMGIMIGAGQLDEELELTTDYIHIIDDSDCMLDQLYKLAERYSKESCGRCVYGFEGVTQITMILSDLVQKKGKSEDIELLLDLCSVMETQALCDIGVSAARTVLTTLENFREEIEEHITKKNCRSVVCAKYVTYHILADLCIGCTDCADACEDDAILGKKKFVHVIDQEECIQCGACMAACEEGAIVKAGAVKPKTPKKPIPCG